MPKVSWIKLSTEIFESRKIRQIENMPDGDAMIVIWLKLLCLAGKTNDNGLIYLTPDIPYTEQMLATELCKPITTVQMALGLFKRFGMIEQTDDGGMLLPNWEKYQNVDKLSEIREYNRIAQQKSRAKRKSLAAVNDESMTCQPCQDTEGEEDKDKDKEIPFSLSASGEQSKMAYLGGSIGRGYVLMSQEQVDDLLEKLSVEEFDHYVSVIASCEERGKHFGKPHYQAILDMVAKDRKKR